MGARKMRNRTKNLAAITLAAAGAGAGLMFLFDPNRGGRRRGFIGGKAVHVAKFMGRGFQRRSRDLGNRAQGVVAETSARMAQKTASDEVLADRVRSKMGRVLTHPRAIDVTAERGVVELRGAVLRSERQKAIRAAESIRGVVAVRHDALLTYSDDQGIPGFQERRRWQELKQPKPRKKFRKLRFAFAVVSGAVATYRALKGSRPGKQRRQATGSSEKAA
jgi:hypothetical protein